MSHYTVQLKQSAGRGSLIITVYANVKKKVKYRTVPTFHHLLLFKCFYIIFWKSAWKIHKKCSTTLFTGVVGCPPHSTNANLISEWFVPTSAWQRWLCWSCRCSHLLSNPSHPQSSPYVPLTSDLISHHFPQQHSLNWVLSPTLRVFMRRNLIKVEFKRKVKFFVNQLCVLIAMESHLKTHSYTMAELSNFLYYSPTNSVTYSF